MSLVNWTSKLSVGSSQLDADHIILIGLLNELHDAAVTGKGEELFETIFDTLKDYTATHFAREEALMRNANYPGYKDHKAYHHRLVSSLHDFAARYYSEKSSLAVSEIEQFLLGWLTNHIQKADFAYKPYLRGEAMVC